MKKFLLVLPVILLVVAGCSISGISQQIGPQTLVAQNPKDLSQAHNAFGFNMVKLLANQDSGKNIFISPTSLSLALSMVYNGASGETKNVMMKSLQLQNLSINMVNQQSRSLIASLQNSDPDIQLSIANSVWTKQEISFQTDFLQTVKDYFNAQIQSIDFNNPNSVNTINSWVNTNTNGKIPTIISSIPPDMIMYLINAVYFKGTWTKAFDKNLTKEKQFTPTASSPETIPLMKQTGNFLYLETKDFQSVSLPYGKNQGLSMYVFLPKNLPDFISSLKMDDWNSWMGKYEDTQGTILLPRFKVEYGKELKDVLIQLGMGSAFGNSADFSLMSPEKGIKISQVRHKTYIDVNEEGTEAAAVTAVVAMDTFGLDSSPSKSFYMEVNKPFFIAIRDNKTQELLFMGAIQRP
jgi:serpin B